MAPEDSDTTSAASRPSPQEELRRRMLRLTLIVSIILTTVAALAVAAVITGTDARRQQLRAEAAEWRSQQQLRESYRDQAAALRRSGMQGRHLEAMVALRKAVDGWQSPESEDSAESPDRLRLREEATAILAMSDLRTSRPVIPLPSDHFAIAADPDQKLLATGSYDGVVIVRDAADGRELQRLEPHISGVDPVLTGLEWRPQSGDSPMLGAWFKSGDAVIWSLPDGAIRYEFHPGAAFMGGGPSPGGFSADGRYMGYYTSDTSRITIIDLNNLTEVTHQLKPGRRAFAIRPNRTEIALADAGSGGHEIYLTDFITGNRKHTWALGKPIHTLTWSGDGTKLAAMSWGGDIFVLNLSTKGMLTLIGHTAQPRSLVFSPDNRTLMSSARDGTTHWWDADRGRLLLISREGKGLFYNGKGTSILYAPNAGGLGEWDLVPSAVLQTVPLPGLPDMEIDNYDLSADGELMAAAVPSGMVLWSTADCSQPFFQLLQWPDTMLFEPSGSLLLIDNGRLFRKKIISGPGGKPMPGPSEPTGLTLPPKQVPRLMSLSADGRTLMMEFYSVACGSFDLSGARPFVPFAETPNLVYYKAPGSITGGGRLTVSPDGRFAAYGYGLRKGATVFATATGKMLWTSPEGGGCVFFTPDNKELIIAGNDTFRRISTSDWQETARKPLPGAPGGTAAVTLTADGSLMALSTEPQTLQLFRGGDMTPILTLTPPVPHSIRGCRISRDGSRVAVACTGNEYLVWNLRRLRSELAALGLDWTDAATAPPVTAAVAAAAPSGGWGFTAWLSGAAIAAAAAAVILLRRHHRLIRDFAGAEAQLIRQRRDLEQANFSLLHSQKMKALGTLAAGMAHDFNNLLSVIRMSNKLIGRETRGHPEVTELVDSVETAVLQGKQVVGSMLSYSRGDEESGPPRPISTIVRDAATLLTTEFLSGITLDLHLDEAAPAVAVPAGRIEQILLNLIVNASEAMQGSGHLTLSVRRSAPQDTAKCVLPPHPADHYVEIAVADSGPGVPPDIADRIFEPFFTTKNAGNERGTGLGLSMVYTIAERDGMGLALHSNPDKGAVFFVFIPAPPTVRQSPTDEQPERH